MTDQQITDACRKHGAKIVSDAAYAAMDGQRTALDVLGLGALRGLGELHRATVIAYGMMGEHDQAADLTQAAIDAAKLP
jgi:hypothetical protein